MRIPVLVLTLLVVQGCALVDTNLSVAVPEDAVLAGPLSGIGNREFNLVRIDDAREDKARIGYVRNGLGMITADMLADEPVETIVWRAIEATLVENGHELTESGIRVAGIIKVFWIEIDENFWDVELIGQIECELTFSNGDQEVYRNDYIGSHSARVGIVTAGGQRQAISGALASLAEAVAYDEALAEALLR